MTSIYIILGFLAVWGILYIIFPSKVRIVERTFPGCKTQYTIQQKHNLFRWWWVDAWINSSSGAACNDTWDTLAEAQKNLSSFDGSKSKVVVVYKEI